MGTQVDANSQTTIHLPPGYKPKKELCHVQFQDFRRRDQYPFLQQQGHLPYFIIFAHVIMEFYYRSQVIGMGFLQTKSDAYVFTALLASIMGESSKEEIAIDCDYLFGRMMKTTFIYNTITHRIIVKYNSNPEYSSWVFGDHSKQVKQYTGDGILASFSYVGVLPQFSEEHVQNVINANS